MPSTEFHEEFSDPLYWNAHYASVGGETTYEWFKSYTHLAAFFAAHLPSPYTGTSEDPRSPRRSRRILHLGCGSSTLPIDLLSQGYDSQVCIDFSAVVIEQMAARYSSSSELEWRVGDVKDMVRGQGWSEEFDIAVDKGTLDTMIFGSVWDPPEEVGRNVGAYIDQVVRVLKPGGTFLYITYRQPHFMKPLLVREGIWDVLVESLQDEGGTFEYFGFVMKKFLGPTSDPIDLSIAQ